MTYVFEIEIPDDGQADIKHREADLKFALLKSFGWKEGKEYTLKLLGERE
jgi:hypothetical protein